ncbi:MAG: glucosaminidase domain-containing protein [Alphaproteobacteria bacterium]|nr:glucosaminidase domain-containing protein [Alphaproteobacteria bacterium]
MLCLSVAVLCGAAIAYPVDRPEKPERDWVALPQVAPKSNIVVAESIDDSMIEVASYDELDRTLEAVDFDLKPVRRGSARVPRFFVEDLPDDFDARMVVSERKQLFVSTVLPLILKANEEVMDERRRLIAIEEQISSGRDIADDDQGWLDDLAEKYRTAPNDFPTLLRRVDAVSPSLALAQSIEESGWGRSRFARLGNALFGQRAWSKGSGFVPKKRGAGESFEVRAFDTLLDSVRSYVLNLNRHNAYDDYRAVRAQMRARETELNGKKLAETLIKYSERRGAYVETLQKLIASNRLQNFESARLETEPVEISPTQLAAR